MPAGGGSRIRRLYNRLISRTVHIPYMKVRTSYRDTSGRARAKRTRTPERTPWRLSRIFLITEYDNLYIQIYN